MSTRHPIMESSNRPTEIDFPTFTDIAMFGEREDLACSDIASRGSKHAPKRPVMLRRSCGESSIIMKGGGCFVSGGCSVVCGVGESGCGG